MIDFKEEFYHILENNSFQNRPSQELIDTDERVAAAVWKNNYESGEYYDSDSGRDRSYHNYKNYEAMAHVFEKYMDNKEFWEKNLSVRTGISILLDEKFQTHFSKVWHNYLDSPQKLLSVIKENQTTYYENYLSLLDKLPEFATELLANETVASYIVQKDANWYLKLDDEKKNNNAIIKNAIAYNAKIFGHLPEEKRNNPFLIAFALNEHPTLYATLSTEERENPDFIKVLMNYKHYDSSSITKPSDIKAIFDALPETHNKMYKYAYLKLCAPQVIKFSANEAVKYDSEYYQTILEAKPDLILPAINNHYSSFKETITTLLKKDIVKYGHYVTDKFLLGFISNPDNIDHVRPQLMQLIDTYKEVKEIPKYLLTIISVDKELEQHLMANPYYDLSNKIVTYKNRYEKNAPWEEFVSIVKNLVDVYQHHGLTYEEAEKVTSSLFGKVSNDVKKEVHLSQKNIFKRLNAMFLHDKITIDVDAQIDKSNMEFTEAPKMKI